MAATGGRTGTFNSGRGGAIMKELFAFILMSMLVTAGSVLAQTTRPAIALSVDVEDGKENAARGGLSEWQTVRECRPRLLGRPNLWESPDRGGHHLGRREFRGFLSFGPPVSPDGKLHVITRIKTPAAYAGDSVSGEFPADMPPAAAVESFPRLVVSECPATVDAQHFRAVGGGLVQLRVRGQSHFLDSFRWKTMKKINWKSRVCIFLVTGLAVTVFSSLASWADDAGTNTWTAPLRAVREEKPHHRRRQIHRRRQGHLRDPMPQVPWGDRQRRRALGLNDLTPRPKDLSDPVVAGQTDARAVLENHHRAKTDALI